MPLSTHRFWRRAKHLETHDIVERLIAGGEEIVVSERTYWGDIRHALPDLPEPIEGGWTKLGSRDESLTEQLLAGVSAAVRENL